MKAIGVLGTASGLIVGALALITLLLLALSRAEQVLNGTRRIPPAPPISATSQRHDGAEPEVAGARLVRRVRTLRAKRSGRHLAGFATGLRARMPLWRISCAASAPMPDVIEVTDVIGGEAS